MEYSRVISLTLTLEEQLKRKQNELFESFNAESSLQGEAALDSIASWQDSVQEEISDLEDRIKARDAKKNGLS